MTLPFAFYGRVSTEDRQDPETSHAWQIDVSKALIQPHGGVVVEEFFDLGVSRRLPWPRRPQASRLLEALKGPNRGFSDLVVGEPQRAFYGAQYENVAPLLQHYGVNLWIPTLGGRVDPANPSHDMSMALWGTISKAERAVVQKRVKDSMRSVAAQGGRHLGGRPPYGYLLADAGVHPNPSKAADGRRLHRLQPDPVTAPVVTLVFDLWNEGQSLGSIAQRLVDLGHPSPSAHDRARNLHRSGQGWAKSAIRAILLNARYEGREVWGKQPTTYELIDPDNPAWGDQKVQRWAAPSDWVFSPATSHAPLVSGEAFAAAQRRFTSREVSVGRKPRVSRYNYLLKGRVACGICNRRMEGSQNNGRSHYRCRVTTDYVLPEGSEHPRSVYLREDVLTKAVDGWIATAFAPDNLEATLVALVESATCSTDDTETKALDEEVRTCDRTLTRCKAAMDSNADLATIIDLIKETETRRSKAEQRRYRLGKHQTVDEVRVRKMIARAPDMAQVISSAKAADRSSLYEALDLRLTYAVHKKVVYLEANAAGAWGSRACPRGDLNPHAR